MFFIVRIYSSAGPEFYLGINYNVLDNVEDIDLLLANGKRIVKSRFYFFVIVGNDNRWFINANGCAKLANYHRKLVKYFPSLIINNTEDKIKYSISSGKPYNLKERKTEVVSIVRYI